MTSRSRPTPSHPVPDTARVTASPVPPDGVGAAFGGGPLDGQHATPVRGRHPVYRDPDGTPVPASIGDRTLLGRSTAFYVLDRDRDDRPTYVWVADRLAWRTEQTKELTVPDAFESPSPSTMTPPPSTAGRDLDLDHPASYTLWTYRGDDPRPPCALCAGQVGDDWQDPPLWAAYGPYPGLRDRGPLCGDCLDGPRARVPVWIADYVRAVALLHRAAQACPAEHLLSLCAGVSAVADTIVHDATGWFADEQRKARS